RAWGSHTAVALAGRALRSIPTCVGLTMPGPGSPPSATGPSPRAWGSRINLNHNHRNHKNRPGPSPRAWGSQKLTCNFARRYLLVIWIVGSFAIHDILNRFPEHRPLNGAMRGRRGIR